MAKITPLQQTAQRLVQRLDELYPVAICELNFDSPLQLLIATILSAQCTDKRVNLVTPQLFARYSTAAKLAAAPIEQIEKLIQSTGFFRNKAKNIKACCQQLVAQHQGQVPQILEQLIALPGVGRKTANVVLGTAFGIASGVVVDTHVGRLSRRIGLTKQTDAVKVERDLNHSLPQSAWIAFSHQLIQHGRRVCASRKPLCEQCGLLDLCQQRGVKPTAKSTKASVAYKPVTRSRRSHSVPTSAPATR